MRSLLAGVSPSPFGRVLLFETLREHHREAAPSEHRPLGGEESDIKLRPFYISDAIISNLGLAE
jgi:hypothetical protein